MSIPRNINPGAAPLLWSTIEDAFRNINQNFTDLYATVADDGSTQVVDFTNLSTDVSPSLTEIYDLGAPSRRWKDLYLSGDSLYLGNAIITATGDTVNLPIGSTIGGLRVDENYFKTFAVSGQDSVVADEGTDTLTLAFGTGVSIATNATTDTITFTNTGVTSVTGSTGISTSASSGAITLSNTGVTSIIAGFGMSINAATGAVTVTNQGLAGLDAGIGITLSARDPLTGTVTVSNSSPNVPQDTFRIVAVTGQSSIIADTVADTLTLTSSGDGLSITTNDATDTITFSNTGVHSLAVSNGLTIDAGTGAINLILDAVLVRNLEGDVTGSVFAEDSTMLIDGTNGQIVGPINSFDGVNSITMDSVNGVIIGGTAGAQIIGAAGAIVYIGGGTSGGTSGNILMGNGTNRVVFVSNIIDTDDSSSLIFEPPVTFNTDVTFENDISVAQRLTVRGSRVINLTELKSVVAASTDFTAFKVAIAAL